MHGTARGAACLEFGRFRLFTRQRELRLGEVPVALGSRAFDVLLILAEAQGELVTKEELLARVWHNLNFDMMPGMMPGSMG